MPRGARLDVLGAVQHVTSAMAQQRLRSSMGLYKGVLHHSRNRLAIWFIEALGVHGSRLNRCAYCEPPFYQGPFG